MWKYVFGGNKKDEAPVYQPTYYAGPAFSGTPFPAPSPSVATTVAPQPVSARAEVSSEIAFPSVPSVALGAAGAKAATPASTSSSEVIGSSSATSTAEKEKLLSALDKVGKGKFANFPALESVMNKVEYPQVQPSQPYSGSPSGFFTPDSTAGVATNDTAGIYYFKACLNEAVKEYSDYVNDPKRWNVIGVTERHGATGLGRVQTLQKSVTDAQDMETIRNALIGYMHDSKMRLQNHSFFSYFLKALQSYPNVVQYLNQVWFNKRYNRRDLSRTNQGALVIKHGSRATLELGDFDYLTDRAADARKTAFHFFDKILGQQEQADGLILLKEVVGSAYLDYRTWMHASPTISSERGHSGFGLTRAETLADNLALTDSFDEALNPFKEFFKKSFMGLGANPRAEEHSFLSFLLMSLKQNPEVIQAMNDNWFSVIGKTLALNKVVDYHSIETSAERKDILNMFMRFSEISEKKAPARIENTPW